MKLNLKNPLIFFDIESTGLDVSRDRIVEISIVKVSPGAPGESNNVDVKTRRFNPLIPISPEAQAVHGISDEDVKDCEPFYKYAKSLAAYMKGCDIAGFNSLKFDIPLLAEEFLRAKDEFKVDVEFDFRKRKLVDVQNIFHKKERRTLEAAYRFYCDKDLKNAHSAEADTMATYEVLEAQLDRYAADNVDPLVNDVDFLARYSCQNRFLDYAGRIVLNDKDEAVFNFGKHKGKKVKDVFCSEPSYYSWMMDGDFTRDTKRIISEIYTAARTR
ncbi:MAG: 3'-5' exonuclease [Bacteroidales bacterium]|nr:3'-5' exonuclease [Candidatus Cacconaster caballi]